MGLISTGFRFYLGFIFLGAAIPKLAARDDFRLALANYRLLPPALVWPIARALPALELTCAFGLFVGFGVAYVGAVSSALLLVFAAAVAVNLRRGRIIDCGCDGAAARKQITWTVVARDAALAAIAIFVAANAPGGLGLAPAWPILGGHIVSEGDAFALLIVAAAAVAVDELAEATIRLRRAMAAQRLAEHRGAAV